jgi:hypothetical protein
LRATSTERAIADCRIQAEHLVGQTLRPSIKIDSTHCALRTMIRLRVGDS